jgi:hypothetical protein
MAFAYAFVDSRVRVAGITAAVIPICLPFYRPTRKERKKQNNVGPPCCHDDTFCRQEASSVHSSTNNNPKLILLPSYHMEA